MEKSGFFGQVLFGKNAKFRIFWSPDFKRTTVIDPDTQPEVGRGDLTYSMAITAGTLGGTTTVQITPNHSFGDEVGARSVLILKL